MRRVLAVLLERQEEVIAQVVRETGKARNEAIAMEVFSSCDSLCYYAKHAKRFLKTRKQRIHGILGLTKQLKIVYKPLGWWASSPPGTGPSSSPSTRSARR